MFDFAKRIIRSSMSSPVTTDVVPGLEAEFFVLDGERWQALSDAICTVTFDEKAKGGPVMVVACEAEDVLERIPLDSVSNLARFIDPEFGLSCFQWIVKKSKDNLEEFGLRFQTEAQADTFAGSIAKLAQQTATVLGEFSDITLVEQVEDDKWEEISESIVFVSKTKKDELYLSVENTKGKLIFHSVVSAGLQLAFKYPHVSFIGLTPLSDEVRILALVFIKKLDFDALKALLVPKKETVRAPKTIIEEPDVEMWEEPGEYISAPVKSRRPKPSEETNRFLQTGHAGRSDLAIVFSEKSSSGFGYRAFNVAGSKVGDSLASLTSLGGRQVRGALIHEADSKVLLLDSKQTDTVFELDLERGSIVNEWKGVGTISSILPVSQTSQSSGEKTFLGINDRSVFLMDPRVPGTRVRGFNYATNVKLSAAATDNSAHIAVGSKSGQIRLFDGTAPNRDGDMKRAKSLLPGLGDPILHVAVSLHGDWLLATCATYLVLVNTVGADGTSGYVKSMSADNEPIVLALSQTDVFKYKLNAIEFRSAAKLDEDRGIILATTGSLAVVWDFNKIKKSGHIAYSIKPMKEFILETESRGTGVVTMYESKLDMTRVSKR